jgi:RNA exonuclease 4
VNKIIDGKVLVGHSIDQDLEHLNLYDQNSKFAKRDISEYIGFQSLVQGQPQKRKLKDLAAEFLNAKIQQKTHSSVVDARVCMCLYRQNQEEMETWLKQDAMMQSGLTPTFSLQAEPFSPLDK